ncbi:MAG TPA: hypothetical protein VFT98_12800 [Myxococcota bacterium]|nr:hypothetical protein [Myxococcota bacterium]
MADASEAQRALRAAWDDMLASLAEARAAIDQPALMPPPASERILAEGYRYLMGHVHAAVERAFHADPLRPQFRNALSPVTRATIDNADAIYFYAPLDGRRSYLLRGAPSPGRKPPHYLIFETSFGVLAGDSGELSELRPGVKTQTGRLDSSELALAPDGSFEILLAPERPAGFTGNFLPTLKVVSQPHPLDPSIGAERCAHYVSGRQLFYDWEREEAFHLEIAPRADVGDPSDYGAEQAARELRRFGEIVRGQMKFWNAFWTIPMGTYGPRPGTIPGIGFPRNAFNAINAASGATGGGMSTNLYAGGVAQLAEDEALIVENRIRLAPQYIGFQVANLWGESIEYANRVGSRNGFQSHVDADGAIRLVLAHRDPGVQNWVDLTGHAEAFMSPRWAYSKTPPAEQWPAITATRVPLSEVRKHLPESTPPFSAAQRRAEIALRQRHVRKRFRAF